MRILVGSTELPSGDTPRSSFTRFLVKLYQINRPQLVLPCCTPTAKISPTNSKPPPPTPTVNPTKVAATAAKHKSPAERIRELEEENAALKQRVALLGKVQAIQKEHERYLTEDINRNISGLWETVTTLVHQNNESTRIIKELEYGVDRLNNDVDLHLPGPRSPAPDTRFREQPSFQLEAPPTGRRNPSRAADRRNRRRETSLFESSDSDTDSVEEDTNRLGDGAYYV